MRDLLKKILTRFLFLTGKKVDFLIIGAQKAERFYGPRLFPAFSAI